MMSKNIIKKYGKKFDIQGINRDILVKQKLCDISKNDTINTVSDETISDYRCRICGSKNTHLYLKGYGMVNYYECDECNTVSIGNIPDISSLYEEEEANELSYLNDSILEKRIEMVAAPKVEFVFDVLKQHKINVASWIDIGCGNGEIIQYINNNYKIMTMGIDTDSEKVRYCENKGLNVKNQYVDTNNKDECKKMVGNFDVVSFFNFLEHLENPKGWIDALYDNLEHDSIIVFEVPRHPSVASLVNACMPSWLYRHICPPYHINVFGEKAIDILLADKFELIGQWGFGQGYLDILDCLYINNNGENKKIINRMLDLSNQVQEIFDSNGLSDTMIYIAKRC